MFLAACFVLKGGLTHCSWVLSRIKRFPRCTVGVKLLLSRVAGGKR